MNGALIKQRFDKENGDRHLSLPYVLPGKTLWYSRNLAVFRGRIGARWNLCLDLVLSKRLREEGAGRRRVAQRVLPASKQSE